MDTPGDPFSGKLRAVNSNPHDPAADFRTAAVTEEADTGHTGDHAGTGAVCEAAVCEAGVREVGGREGPDPTRYGDWELRGRCIDF
jgi:hypothetical protein